MVEGVIECATERKRESENVGSRQPPACHSLSNELYRTEANLMTKTFDLLPVVIKLVLTSGAAATLLSSSSSSAVGR